MRGNTMSGPKMANEMPNEKQNEISDPGVTGIEDAFARLEGILAKWTKRAWRWRNPFAFTSRV